MSNAKNPQRRWTVDLAKRTVWHGFAPGQRLVVEFTKQPDGSHFGKVTEGLEAFVQAFFTLPKPADSAVVKERADRLAMLMREVGNVYMRAREHARRRGESLPD